MPRNSAGLLMYRLRSEGIQVLLVHPGGPFWAGKDAGAWTIPKGETGPDEDLLATAKREFQEELGAADIDRIVAMWSEPTGRGDTISAVV